MIPATQFVHYRPWSALDVFGSEDLKWNTSSKNDYVESLQYGLTLAGYYISKRDGYYGNETMNAVSVG